MLLTSALLRATSNLIIASSSCFTCDLKRTITNINAIYNKAIIDRLLIETKTYKLWLGHTKYGGAGVPRLETRLRVYNTFISNF